MRILFTAAILLSLFSAGPVLADDWTAVKLRGNVLQLVDGEWGPLERGDVVPDSRVIRTMGGGRVTFVRGEETLDLGGNTQIQIHDRGGCRPFTTVKQYFGKVQVEAEVKQVQHFAVQTPYLVAVVKGTKFTVVSGKSDSQVSVERGAVSVADKDDGSHASCSPANPPRFRDGTLQVAGRGDLPVVRDVMAGPSNLGRRKLPSAAP